MSHDLTPLHTPDFRHDFTESLGIPQLELFEEIDSTQNRLRSLAEENAPEWTVVVTDYQTAGRGQHGRSWISAPNAALMFSVLLRPGSVESLALLPIRTGLAVARALQPWVSSGTRSNRILMKWPNDLILDDRKVGGILCEGTIRGEECQALVGIGINIRQFAIQRLDDALMQPVWIEENNRQHPDRLEILKAILTTMMDSLSTDQGVLSTTELSEYQHRDWLLNRELVQPLEGIATGINELGHLNIRLPDGTTDSVTGGSVRLR